MAGACVQTARPRAHADQERSTTENPAPRREIYRTPQETAPADIEQSVVGHVQHPDGLNETDCDHHLCLTDGRSMHFSLVYRSSSEGIPKDAAQNGIFRHNSISPTWFPTLAANLSFA